VDGAAVTRETAAAARSEAAFYRFGRDESGRYRFRPEELPPGVRAIGEGEVGGKARGLIFVMHHLAAGGALTAHDRLLRFPDSVILTTELFDRFMDENDLQSSVLLGCDATISLEELGQRIVGARFPSTWLPALADLLRAETRPLVVRSSSVMEDDPDHSYAGIYLSEFLPNRGTLEDRVAALVHAIKRIYASTFAANARAYRKRHGLDWRREKMAVLVQNMIGAHYADELFYPLVGGVAFSRNYYPWSRRLRPEDGVVRLVVGTGTRAVGREYARVFSPRHPGLRPEGTDTRSIVRYSQETVDVLDLEAGGLVPKRLGMLRNPLLAKICSVYSVDGSLRRPTGSRLRLAPGERYLASFDRLIEGNALMPFTPLMRELLPGLETLIGFPVDIEFAVSFQGGEASAAGTPLLYILQARPLGVRELHKRVRVPAADPERTVLVSRQVLGNGRRSGIHHLLLVEPGTYRWDRGHEIARSIGAINERLVDAEEPYILIGPGRWGSSNPQLGVPVQYGEISGAAVIVEMSTEAFAPELSYGTHFYADMVAAGLLYLPLNEARGDALNRPLLARQTVVDRDAFLVHYRVGRGLEVYVDGERRGGLIALSA
jgi:hypothetical protein